MTYRAKRRRLARLRPSSVSAIMPVMDRGRAALLVGCAAIAAVITAPGCSSSAVGDVDQWADRACACESKQCAAAVRTEFVSWIGDQGEVRGSRSERTRIEKSAKRLFACLAKLQMATADAPAEPASVRGHAAAPVNPAPERGVPAPSAATSTPGTGAEAPDPAAQVADPAIPAPAPTTAAKP